MSQVKQVGIASTVVHIKATAIHDNGNGTFAIYVPVRPVSEEQMKLLEELFPNLLEQVGKVLDKENLLAALASPSEVLAPKENKNDEPDDTYLPVSPAQNKNDEPDDTYLPVSIPPQDLSEQGPDCNQSRSKKNW
jgi:hypothetical protein